MAVNPPPNAKTANQDLTHHTQDATTTAHFRYSPLLEIFRALLTAVAGGGTPQ